MEQRAGFGSQNSRRAFSSLPTLRRVSPNLAKRQDSIPRLGDIWIPRSAVSSNHVVNLYILGVEDLLQEGDRVLHVEHSGSRSRLISWRVWKDQDGGWRFQ